MKIKASRWSKGNRIFPTEIILEASGLTIRVPGIFNSKSEFMEYSYISSVSVNTPLIGFSTLVFYTSGSQVSAHGFTKKEAKIIQETITKGKNK